MTKSKNKTPKKKDDGYPFDTGHWAKWSNRKRLDWMVNLRDKLRDKYKDKLNVSDEQIDSISADIVTMEKLVAVEERNPQLASDFNAKPSEQKLELQRKWLEDLEANDYENARILGFSPEDIDKQNDALGKFERELTEWKRREDAKKILGSAPRPPVAPIKLDPEDAIKLHVLMACRSVDDTKLKEAFASGDEEASNREFMAWVEQLEAIADRDPIFAKWFEEFRDDQEKLLRWDDVIGDEEDE